MRFRARTDANHTAVVRALRDAGCLVFSLASVGGGCPDLLVYHRGKRALRIVEIKDGAKVPSARRLRASQVSFAAQGWPVLVALDAQDAVRKVAALEERAT